MNMNDNQENAKSEIIIKLNAKKDYINSLEPTFLGKAGVFNNIQTYICPCCQSGSGKNRTGLSKIPHKNSYHCFACGESGDVIHFAEKYYNVDFKEALNKLSSYYGITKNTDFSSVKKYETEDLDIDLPCVDQLEYFNKVRKDLDPSYLEKRGISEKTQHHFWVGTDKSWVNPIAKEKFPNKKLYTTPRCIIPTSRFSYLARDIRENIPEFAEKFSKAKYGTTRLFNTALKGNESELVYIVEGEIDAMSIYDATDGKIQAIGLGSTAMWRHLYNEISFYPHLQGKTYVLMLDNDNAGNMAMTKIEETFKIYGIPYIIQEYPKEYNDPNEYLVKNRAGFAKMIEETVMAFEAEKEEPEI